MSDPEWASHLVSLDKEVLLATQQLHQLDHAGVDEDATLLLDSGGSDGDGDGEAAGQPPRQQSGAGGEGGSLGRTNRRKAAGAEGKGLGVLKGTQRGVAELRRQVATSARVQVSLACRGDLSGRGCTASRQQNHGAVRA